MSNIQGNYRNFSFSVFMLLNNIEFNSSVFLEKINFLRLLDEFVFSSLHRLDIPCWILDIQSFYPLDLRRSQKNKIGWNRRIRCKLLLVFPSSRFIFDNLL
jgi:hypothetical protein